jgi:hypothetical protein
MRILDHGSGKPLKDICIYLTPSEAKEVIDSLQGLLIGEMEHHVHVSDRELEHEVTMTVYTDGNLSTFDERSKRLIKDDV